jgi:hypothetical protein
MKLRESDLLEFKRICKEELGLELTDAEAAEEAQRLIDLVKAVVSKLSLRVDSTSPKV